MLTTRFEQLLYHTAQPKSKSMLLKIHGESPILATNQSIVIAIAWQLVGSLPPVNFVTGHTKAFLTNIPCPITRCHRRNYTAIVSQMVRKTRTSRTSPTPPTVQTSIRAILLFHTAAVDLSSQLLQFHLCYVCM